DHGPLAGDEASDPRQRLDVRVVPDPQIARADPAVARHRRRLDHDQRTPADGATAEVDQVPIVGHPLAGAILAHRRHHDPVAECHAPDRQRTEEVDLGDLAIVIDLRRTSMDPTVAQCWSIEWLLTHGALLRSASRAASIPAQSSQQDSLAAGEATP